MGWSRILGLAALAAVPTSVGCLLAWDLDATCAEWCTGEVYHDTSGVAEGWEVVNPFQVECSEGGTYCGQPGVGFEVPVDRDVEFGTCEDICEEFFLFDDEPMACANACTYEHDATHVEQSRFSTREEREGSADDASRGGAVFWSGDGDYRVVDLQGCKAEFDELSATERSPVEIRCCCVSRRSLDYSD